MPEFNLPDPGAADFNSKIIELLRQVFGTLEAGSKNFQPIQEPQERRQVGDVFFDKDTNKLRMVTPTGIKTLSVDP